MRAAVLESIPSSLVIKEIPDPKPAAGDAVVKVLAVHVLSYAKQVFSGELPYPNLLPLVPGQIRYITERLTNRRLLHRTNRVRRRWGCFPETGPTRLRRRHCSCSR